jgi:hypothetical protein
MSKPSKPKPSEVLNALRQSWRGSAPALDAVWTACLEEMLTLFYPPFRADDDVEMLDLSVVAIRAYAEDLASHPEARLRKAWREVRRAHKAERWPTINAILEAIGSGEKSNAYGANGRRDATPEEIARQEALYGFAWIRRINAAEAAHHRQQQEDLAARRITTTQLHAYPRRERATA